MVDSLFIFGIVAAGVGIAFTVGAIFDKERRRHRAICGAIRRARTCLIRDATEGSTVKIAGRVRYLGAPLRAPLSHRVCAQYHVVVAEGLGEFGLTFLDEESAVDLLVEDDTGKARVAMKGARVAVRLDREYRSGNLYEVAPDLASFLRERGAQSHALGKPRSLSFREGTIEEGERVAVVGCARWEVDPAPDARSSEGGYRDAPKRLAIESPAGSALLITDDEPTVADALAGSPR